MLRNPILSRLNQTITTSNKQPQQELTRHWLRGGLQHLLDSAEHFCRLKAFRVSDDFAEVWSDTAQDAGAIRQPSASSYLQHGSKSVKLLIETASFVLLFLVILFFLNYPRILLQFQWNFPLCNFASLTNSWHLSSSPALPHLTWRHQCENKFELSFRVSGGRVPERKQSRLCSLCAHITQQQIFSIPKIHICGGGYITKGSFCVWACCILWHGDVFHNSRRVRNVLLWCHMKTTSIWTRSCNLLTMFVDLSHGICFFHLRLHLHSCFLSRSQLHIKLIVPPFIVSFAYSLWGLPSEPGTHYSPSWKQTLQSDASSVAWGFHLWKPLSSNENSLQVLSLRNTVSDSHHLRSG